MPERGRLDAQQGLPQREHGLPEVGARLRLAEAAPPQRPQLVTGMTLAGRQGEVREQRLGLAARDRDRRPAVQPGLEATEEGQREPRHAPPKWARR